MKFIGYIPGGYPTVKKSLERAEYYIEAGCRALEISFPPEDPSREGPVLADLMRKALAECNDYNVYMNELKVFRNKHPQIEIILLVFWEVIEKIGICEFVDFCNEIEVNSLICPDIWEHQDCINLFIDKGVGFSCPIHYDSCEEEINRCKDAKTFIYMQAFPNEGQTIKEGFETPNKIINYLREIGVEQPIYCGVGVKSPEHTSILKKAGADGFFVGSTLLAKLDNKDDLVRLTKEFIEAGRK